MFNNVHIAGRLAAARQHDLLEAAERRRLVSQARNSATPGTARPWLGFGRRRTRHACASCSPTVTR